MPYVLIEGGVVILKQPGPRDGFIECPDDVVCGFLYDGETFSAPEPPVVVSVPRVEGARLVRFSGTAPVEVHENCGVGPVTRISKGRFRIAHIEPMPSDSYSALPAVMDAAVRGVRLTARTAAYVEVRVTDLAGAVADSTEITVEIKRVV